MANTIKIKRKTTTGAPTIGSLVDGEMCLVVPDKTLYQRVDATNLIIVNGAALIATTSTTSNAIATGSKTFALDAPTSLVIGQTVKAHSASGVTNYVAGNITAISPTSMTVNVTEIGGTGTKTDWVISLTGLKGATGTTGATPSFSGTSTSSKLIALGSIVFTTQSGKAWTVGQRVRASVTASPTVNYVEGVITAYSSTTLTFTVDLIGGSGTFAAWTINLAGEKGADGADGTNGTNGTLITVSTTAPASPTLNDLWVDTN